MHFDFLGQENVHLNNIPNQPEDKNIMGLLQKYEAFSSIPDENKYVLNKNQEASKQYERKIAMYVTHIYCYGIILGIWFALLPREIFTLKT